MLYEKKNKKFSFIIIVVGIGFATIATTLYLNGNTTISSNSGDFDVKFTKTILGENDISDSVISADGRSITYETEELEKKDDESVLTYTVTNNSSLYDAEVSVNCTAGTHNDLYSVTNNLDSPVEAKESKDGTVTVKLLQDPEEEIEEEFTCNLNVTATERTSVGQVTTIASSVKIGDYVEMIPTLDTYTVLGTDTGSTDSTIKPNELTLWRIISKNDDGTIDAVSE